MDTRFNAYETGNRTIVIHDEQNPHAWVESSFWYDSFE